MLKQKIEQDLKQALKTRQQLTASVLRLLLADIHNQEIAKKELTEDDILAVLRQAEKKHRDSIDQFRTGGREDLAAKEEEELKIIQSYLPQRLSGAELDGLIQEVVAEAKPAGPADFGRVMKILMPRVCGRADGKTISEKLRAVLTNLSS